MAIIGLASEGLPVILISRASAARAAAALGSSVDAEFSSPNRRPGPLTLAGIRAVVDGVGAFAVPTVRPVPPKLLDSDSDDGLPKQLPMLTAVTRRIGNNRSGWYEGKVREREKSEAETKDPAVSKL